jgi:hypothetical protein
MLGADGEGTTIFQNIWETTHPVTQYHVPEDLNVQQHWHENLKSRYIKELLLISIPTSSSHPSF